METDLCLSDVSNGSLKPAAAKPVSLTDLVIL